MKAKTFTILMVVIFFCSNIVQSEENWGITTIGSGSEKYNGSAQLTESILPEEPGNAEDRDKGMETLSGDNSHSGGYGALFFKGSSFKNTSILMMGIRGAWVVNRSFGLGIDLNGLLPVSKYDDVDPAGLSDAILLGGYGGLLLEPVVWSKKLVHVTFPLSIGAGWLGYVEDWEDEYYYGGGDLMDNDVFWYIEPGINAEVNITNYFRIDVGISKRFTQDLSLYNTPSDAFDKLNYSLTLKFGGF
jgi:hypothetical protein